MPSTFTESVYSQSPIVCSASGPTRASTPALAHTRFTPPARATISFAAAASESAEVTSTPMPNALPPAAAISAATASALVRRRSATATVMPSAPKVRAMPRPIPLPPPVTTATRPLSSSIPRSLLLPEIRIVPCAVERLHAAAVGRELRHAQQLHRLAVAEIVDRGSLELLHEGPPGVAEDERRESEEMSRDLPRSLQQPFLRQHLVDRAPVVGHLCRDLLPHQLRIAETVPTHHQWPDVLDAVAGGEVAREVGQVLEVRVVG